MKNGEPSVVSQIPKNLRDIEENAYKDIIKNQEGGYDSQDSSHPP